MALNCTISEIYQDIGQATSTTINCIHLTAVFQENPRKPVLECHHSGFHWSNHDGGGVTIRAIKHEVKSSLPTLDFTGWMRFPTNSGRPLNGESITFQNSLTWSLPSLSWWFRAQLLPWRGQPSLSAAFWRQYLNMPTSRWTE